MNGPALTLGLMGALAAAGAHARDGSRAARQPSPDTALVLPETIQGLPAVVLVDAARLSRVASEDQLLGMRSCVLGFIRLSYPMDHQERITSRCETPRTGLGPLQVWNSAAEKGWGPLTYDAALWVARDLEPSSDSLNGYLIPDRNVVYSGACRIWTYYAEHRKSDVSSRRLSPDCPRHGLGVLEEDPVLDRMYRLKRRSLTARRIDALHTRGWRLLTDLEEAELPLQDGSGFMDREELEQAFLKLGEALFEEHF